MRTFQVHRPPSQEGGQALLEFAFAFPILVLIVLAMLDFSWMFYSQQAITHAVREAGRVGQVGRTTYGGTTYSSVQDTVAAVLRDRSCGLLPSANAEITYRNDTTTNTDVGLANSTFTIRVDYRHRFITPLGSFIHFFASSGEVAGDYTVRIQSTFKSEKYNDQF